MNKPNNIKKYIIGGTLLLLFLWLSSPFILLIHHSLMHFIMPLIPMTHNEIGTFGDSFGHINSLFSGAALVGVVLSLYLQHTELTNFGDTFKIDSFERTFFNQLTLFIEQRNRMSYTKGSSDSHKHGSDYIALMYRRIMEHSMENTPTVEYEWKSARKNNVRFSQCCDRVAHESWGDVVKYVWSKNESFKSDSELYRRSMLLLLRFIQTYCPTSADSEKYRDIVFSQLTKDEFMFLIFWKSWDPEDDLSILLDNFKIDEVCGISLLETTKWYKPQ